MATTANFCAEKRQTEQKHQAKVETWKKNTHDAKYERWKNK